MGWNKLPPKWARKPSNKRPCKPVKRNGLFWMMLWVVLYRKHVIRAEKRKSYVRCSYQKNKDKNRDKRNAAHRAWYARQDPVKRKARKEKDSAFRRKRLGMMTWDEYLAKVKLTPEQKRGYWATLNFHREF